MLELMEAPSKAREAVDQRGPEFNAPSRVLHRLENWGRWVLRHWREVQIDDGVFSSEQIAGRPRLHAEACISLGTLLPSDVRVELVPADPLPEGHPLWHGKAMFSVAALHNGRYWFAVNASADPADGERLWTVRVRPARPLIGFSEMPVVERSLDQVPAGTPRRRERRERADFNLRREQAVSA